MPPVSSVSTDTTENAPSADDPVPDDQLMLAYVGGDRAAFDLLYARHESGLYRFVRRWP